MPAAVVDRWLAALQARHTTSLTPRELTRALRALSARYVERRAVLQDRSPLDSAGKRAAFAAFYGPLHFFTAREAVRSLAAGELALDHIADLGCGTGVASAAWALEVTPHPHLEGVDANAWTVAEAHWTWRQLGLDGRARRGDLVDAASRLEDGRPERLTRAGVIAGWSVNELAPAARNRLLPALLALSQRGASVLVLEPLARAATPWWDEWASAFGRAGGRADEWAFDAGILPAAVARLDEAAGFRRERLGARTLWLNGRP